MNITSLRIPRAMSLPTSLSARHFSSNSRDLDLYDPIDPENMRTGTRWKPASVAKYLVLGLLGVAAIFLVLASGLESTMVRGLDMHRDFARSKAHDVIDLDALPPMRPYRQDASCKQDGSICICSDNFKISGVDDNGFNTFRKQALHSACQQWTFKVGDVILVERPSELKKAYIPAYVVSTVSNSPVVHAAIVTKVPPLGVNQTADNIIVTEALKGSIKQVVQNNFRSIVERFQFGGISIRRVDKRRFPVFFSTKRQKEMTKWGDAKVGEGFDEDMLIPLKRRFAAKERYVPIDPDCKERSRALAMYKKGGPGKWICSELVGWTLAFAGGINTDYGLLSDSCEVPSWTVKNVQPLPGQLSDMDVFDQKMLWHMPCTVTGCFIGVPTTPDWVGGTMQVTTTTTTTTSTTRTASSTSTTSKIVPATNASLVVSTSSDARNLRH